MGQQAQKYRQLLKSGAFIVSPGVYDGYSIRLVEAAGFSCASTSGAAISNALLGYPDAGAMGLYENVNHCRHLARAVSIPLTADADTGYGNPMNVHYTIQQFEEAGVAGVNIEDQVSPKRCGHMPGKDVVSTGEMVRKIEAACLARKDDAFTIVARTDAIAVEGIEGAVKRAKAYATAGADMIFPDAVKSEDDIARIVDAAGHSGDDQHGLRHPLASDDAAGSDSAAEGARRAPHLAAAHVACGEHSRHGDRLQLMRQSVETGVPVDRPDLLAGIEDIMKLMGYDAMRELEAQLVAAPLGPD